MNSSGTIALATVLCTLIGVAPWHVIAADDYPSRPVTVVVPFTPGGSTDIMARYEAEVLQRALGQSFVVDNKTGACGSIGISYAAKAAPDGYTLLHAPSIIILLPYVMKSILYDFAKDFAPIMLTGLTQFALVVSPALPVNSVKDLIALAKSKPGELTYASSGIGSPHQIFAEEFNRAFSLAPVRRNQSSISSTLRWPRILNGWKPPSASRGLASWRNGIRQPSLLPSSPSKARNGVKQFERPALRRSDLGPVEA